MTQLRREGAGGVPPEMTKFFLQENFCKSSTKIPNWEVSAPLPTPRRQSSNLALRSIDTAEREFYDLNQKLTKSYLLCSVSI